MTRRRENDINRKVHREIFDNAVVDVQGVPTLRRYVSRYDKGGKFISQGYTHHGPASEQQQRSYRLTGTWREE